MRSRLSRLTNSLLRLRAVAGCATALFASLHADAAENATAAAPGSFLLASAEGVSAFTREGRMEFGNFVTSLKDGVPTPLAWSDMIYDAHLLPSGHYLVSAHEWVREMTRDGAVVWEYRVQKPVELKTCVPLPNGDVMTVDATQMELLQLTDQGRRVAKRIPVPTDAKASPHARYNLLRRTSAGTYLLALRAEKAFVEVDESGKELWRRSVPDLPVVAERLANGNTLMSCRGGLLEVTPAHEVAWEVKTADITEFPVVIFGGFHRFANGNTLITNSDWHYKQANENRVQVFEITRDKRVVWKLGVEAFKNTKPGSLEPRTGLIEHRLLALQWLPPAK